MFAIREARLFDGVGDELRHGSTVVIDKGVIVAVDGDSIGRHVEVLDLGDVTLIPGLIDTHIHLGFDASPLAVQHLIDADDGTLQQRMRDAALVALAAGITTVRDLGDRRYAALALREHFASGVEVGPTIIAAGPPLTTTGGHCHFMGGEVAGEQAMRDAVEEHLRRGVDVVKVMVSGGVLTPGSDAFACQYTLAELKMAVETAHRHGVALTAHAHSSAAVALAVEAGVDGLEHCSFLVPERVDAPDCLIEEIAARRVAVCPTFSVVPGAHLPPFLATRVDHLRDIFSRLHRLGGRLVAGSDGGIEPSVPHDTLPHSIRSLASLGLSPPEALRAATSVAAEVCGLSGRKGVIVPGADADIVAVGGDPFEDIGVLLDVRAVLCRGRRVGDGPGG